MAEKTLEELQGQIDALRAMTAAMMRVVFTGSEDVEQVYQQMILVLEQARVPKTLSGKRREGWETMRKHLVHDLRAATGAEPARANSI